jgi:hypothetical protein
LVGLFVALTLALMPTAALAQGVPTPANSAASKPQAPASPAQGAANSPSPAQAPGAVQPPAGASASAAAAGSAAPTSGEASAQAASSTSPVPSEAPARALPTPVGGNTPQEQQEPLPYFAYLLIILGVVWFFAAMAGIVRLMSRPRSPAYLASVPEAEQDRPFLSFIMPFGALITVAIVVTIWGMVFLQTSHISELYPLAIDLFVVCLVMLIATAAALKGGGQPRTEVH